MEVIAHRGASAYAPENTFAAFDLALKQGADTLELDVRATADGRPVVVHDPTLARTTGDPRAVAELRADELASLDHPSRPPTLDAVFERYGERTRYLIDLKDPDPTWELEVVRSVERHGLDDRCTLQSFDPEGLGRVHRHAPGLPFVLLYRRATSVGLDLDAVPSFASGIGPWHPVVDAALVDGAVARGLAVRPWTVDDAPEVHRLAALGVRHVVTNRPDVVVAAYSAASTRAVAPPSSRWQNRSRNVA